MQKELIHKTKKDEAIICSDDLIFDGKKIIIPSYYSSSLLDYISNYNNSDIFGTLPKVDAEDFLQFKRFLEDIETFKESKFSHV